MTLVNAHEAKTNFSRLVELALKGEEVVVARSGRALVKLVPVAGPAALRPMGLDAQAVGEAFLEESVRPLTEEELAAFYRPGPLGE